MIPVSAHDLHPGDVERAKAAAKPQLPVTEPARERSLPVRATRLPSVLYINHDFPPMSGPGIWRALSFTTHLAREGHAVTVLCGRRSFWCKRFDASLLESIPPTLRVVRIG